MGSTSLSPSPATRGTSSPQSPATRGTSGRSCARLPPWLRTHAPGFFVLFAPLLTARGRLGASTGSRRLPLRIMAVPRRVPTIRAWETRKRDSPRSSPAPSAPLKKVSGTCDLHHSGRHGQHFALSVPRYAWDVEPSVPRYAWDFGALVRPPPSVAPDACAGLFCALRPAANRAGSPGCVYWVQEITAPDHRRYAQGAYDTRVGDAQARLPALLSGTQRST